MKYPPSAEQCRISEIFSSLQGEGTHLGERHLFIRFEECNIHCTYCDEDKAGQPMTQQEVLETAMLLERTEGPHAFVSLTGGEPLLYLPFLKPLMQALRARGMRTYLETNGILWPALQQVIDLTDCVAMDMKPASVTGEKNFYDEHRKFLQLAKTRETFIKIVVSKKISIEEFDKLMDITLEIAPHTPVILQPVTDGKEGHEDPDLMQVLGDLQRRGMARKLDIRIVPRFHKILKIR